MANISLLVRAREGFSNALLRLCRLLCGESLTHRGANPIPLLAAPPPSSLLTNSAPPGSRKSRRHRLLQGVQFTLLLLDLKVLLLDLSMLQLNLALLLLDLRLQLFDCVNENGRNLPVVHTFDLAMLVLECQ